MNDLQIREATPQDAASYREHMLRIYDEADVDIPFTPDEYPRTVEQDASNIATYRDADNSLFLVAVTPENEVVGSIRLYGGRIKAVQHVADLALYVNAEYRDQAVGSRLMKIGLDWAHSSGIIKRVQLEVYARNTRAIRVYEKYGFVKEGHRQRSMFQKGEYLDEYLMALLID